MCELTFLDASDDILEEVDGDALRRWQVSEGVNRQELVDLVLGTELGAELCRGDLLHRACFYYLCVTFNYSEPPSVIGLNYSTWGPVPLLVMVAGI